MNAKFGQIYKETETFEPSPKLERLILKRIDRERSKQRREKMLLSWAGLTVSGAGIIYALAAFGQAILNSEFWSMITLAYSDIGIVAGHWQDFAYSLLETFPAVNLILIIAPVFSLLLFFHFLFSLNHKSNNKLHYKY